MDGETFLLDPRSFSPRGKGQWYRFLPSVSPSPQGSSPNNPFRVLVEVSRVVVVDSSADSSEAFGDPKSPGTPAQTGDPSGLE